MIIDPDDLLLSFSCPCLDSAAFAADPLDAVAAVRLLAFHSLPYTQWRAARVAKGLLTETRCVWQLISF